MLQHGKGERKTLPQKYNKIKLKLNKIIVSHRRKENINKRGQVSEKDRTEKLKVYKREDKIIVNSSLDNVKMSQLSSLCHKNPNKRITSITVNSHLLIFKVKLKIHYNALALLN